MFRPIFCFRLYFVFIRQATTWTHLWIIQRGGCPPIEKVVSERERTEDRGWTVVRFDTVSNYEFILSTHREYFQNFITGASGNSSGTKFETDGTYDLSKKSHVKGKGIVHYGAIE